MTRGRTLCAECGTGGELDAYPTLARGRGWPHNFAHRACAARPVEDRRTAESTNVIRGIEPADRRDPWRNAR